MIHWKSEDERFTIYIGDAVSVMRELPDESVDMVVADPPFGLSKPGGTTCRGGRRASSTKGSWDLPKTPMCQLAWAMTWMSEARRILRPTGSIMVCASMHNAYSSGFSLQNLGYRLLNDITWVKIAPSPNLGCRTLQYAHESILWASLGPRAKHYFNYDELKQLNDDRQQQDVWKFGRPSKPELVHSKHPTQKPVSLLRRCLLTALPEGGLVVDPFAGSGTTGVAAALNPSKSWSYIGIELDPEWNEVAKRRIQDALKPAARTA